ncbi:DUF4113 domain-containing protein [Halomonas korlensis]|uniref:DUF4113 domain-containing protein n=1 Tax=Halomonas korlensis TaxID=463301 RepID=UPI000B7DF676
MAAMDDLNQKMGRGTIKLGLPNKKAAWHLRCANRAPRWATRWDALSSPNADWKTEKKI